MHKTPLSAEAEILAAEIALKKRAKSLARIAKMLAKKRGDLKKMPLSGKMALKAIAAGKW